MLSDALPALLQCTGRRQRHDAPKSRGRGRPFVVDAVPLPRPGGPGQGRQGRQRPGPRLPEPQCALRHSTEVSSATVEQNPISFQIQVSSTAMGHELRGFRKISHFVSRRHPTEGRYSVGDGRGAGMEGEQT